MRNIEACNLIENNENLPRYFGDRFIPRRYPINNNLSSMCSRHNILNGSRTPDIIRLRKSDGYWRTKNYTEVLKTVLPIKKERICKLTDPVVASHIARFYHLDLRTVTVERIDSNTSEFDWPCKPRVKPMAFTDSTHDLPGFRANFGPNIISWSPRGPVAASFRKDLVLWIPQTLSTLVYRLNENFAISYNPSGTILAVSCKKADLAVLQLWDCTEQNFIYSMTENVLNEKLDQIICIDWEPSGGYIACGTIGGNVIIFRAPDLKKIRTLENSWGKISTVKFSPKRNYLVANNVVGNTKIWSWKSCDLCCEISKTKIRNSYMDWHPWNGTDLVMADSCPAAIFVFNVPSKTIVARYQRTDETVYIEYIIFNKISAELLVSCTIIEIDGNSVNEILVLASLDRIVDVLKSHDDTVCFMIWNPNGMQLATACDDDALYIWNFFALKDSPKHSEIKPKKAEKKFGTSHKLGLFRCLR
ncbi:unnamed protein product [Hermetia illucens]|uniref:Protein cortex n=1 Tax=Hermetia illucens TaxID=343691 RepID=A0A7R8UHZ6_HERIL|nr:unnamed protein product [Hermetia illucens]